MTLTVNLISDDMPLPATNVNPYVKVGFDGGQKSSPDYFGPYTAQQMRDGVSATGTFTAPSSAGSHTLNILFSAGNYTSATYSIPFTLAPLAPVAPAAPMPTLTADSPIAYNGRSTLTWGWTGGTPDICTTSANWSNSGNLKGQGLSDPLTGNTRFTYSCTNAGGTNTTTADVTVCAPGQTVANGVCVTPPPSPVLSLAGPDSKTIPYQTVRFVTSYTITNGGASPVCELLDYQGTFLAYNPCSSGSITWDTPQAPPSGATYGYNFKVSNGSQTAQNYFTVTVSPAPTVNSCTPPLTQLVTVACDPNALGEAAISGSVIRSQTKSQYPSCTFPTPVTVSNSTYVSDTCAYPTPTTPVTSVVTPPALGDSCANGATNPTACDQCPNGSAFIGQSCSSSSCGSGGCSGSGGTPYNPTGSLVCNNGAVNPDGGCSIFPPSVSLAANPPVIDVGQSTTLTWSSSGADSCMGIGFTASGLSGGTSSGALYNPGTIPFQITCSGAGGSASDSATVEVLNPVATISANPTRVRTGSTSNIAWSASGILSCTVSGPSGVLANGSSDRNYAFSDGSPRAVTITKQSIFTITCQTHGAPIKKSVIVNVVPIFQEF